MHKNIRILKIMIHRDSFTFTRKAVKIRQAKKQGIHKDGPIASMTRFLRVGQGQYLVGTTGRFAVHFHIPERHRNQETDIAQDSKFGKKRMECRAGNV